MMHKVSLSILTLLATLCFCQSSLAGLDDDVAEHAVSPLSGDFELGYHGLKVEGDPSRAAEYTYLDDQGTDALNAKLDITGNLEDRHFFLDLDYQNEKDYTFDGHLDNHGQLMFTVMAQSLYHNLEHLTLSPDAWRRRGAPVNGNVVWVDTSENNPEDVYGLQVEQYSANVRAKTGTYPAHVEVDYWRLERSGQTQMRYLEHGSWDPAASGGTCNSCHLRSQTREVDRVIEQVQFSTDGHAGAINYEITGTYRQFDDNEPIPADNFGDWGSHRIGGDLQHDEDPESRFYSGTARVSTSYAGGLTSSLAFTMAKRENRSELVDVFQEGGRRIEAETDYYKAAGDMSWVLSDMWSFNMRYRMLDLDNTTSETIDMPRTVTVTDYPAEVRQNPDFRRHWSNFKASFRPAKKLTLQFEYDRQDISRDNTASPASFINETIESYKDLHTWYLSEDETISRYKVGFFARPKGHGNHKVNGWYQYKTNDNPSYGTQYTKAHEGFLSAYMTQQSWGVGLNLHALSGENDEYQRPYFVDVPRPVGPDVLGGMTDIDREVDQQNAGLSCWVSPADSFNVSLSYAYFHTLIKQVLQFGVYETGTEDPITDETDYDQTTHSVTLATTWTPLAPVTLRASGSFSESNAYYDPDFATVNNWPFSGFTADVNSDLLRELSEIDIYQTTVKAGVDYRIEKDWTCSVNYGFDQYEDKLDELFDGTVHTFMGSVAHNW